MASPPLPYVAITPCRIADTRGNGFTGQFGPPALAGGVSRDFTLTGQCGIAGTAQAVSLNITVTNTLGPGFISVYPSGAAAPLVSTLNYVAGQTIANAAVVPLGTAGGITVIAGVSGTNLIIDTNGYYAGSIVTSLNTLMGDVALAAGTDLTLTPSGQTLMMSANSASTNTPNTLVRRDGAGSFSAGTVALSGNLMLTASSSSAGNVLKDGSLFLHTLPGSGFNNTFLGINSGNYAITGGDNTGIGGAALASNSTGSLNTALGSGALINNTSGSANTAIGTFTLFLNTAGGSNTAIGSEALRGLTDGGRNIAIGATAAINLTTGFDNIYIGNSAPSIESFTIRLGQTAFQRRTFIAGIRDVTTDMADGLPVLVDSLGQLGTMSSSARGKTEIADVGEASSALLRLRPVSFLYRTDKLGIRQYGLVAEEVAEVMPELVQLSPSGQPATVRYHFLVPLLLNELQKDRKEIQDLRTRLERLEALVPPLAR